MLKVEYKPLRYIFENIMLLRCLSKIRYTYIASYRSVLPCLFISVFTFQCYSQDISAKVLTTNFEFRPRFEIKNFSNEYYLYSQRVRLGVCFKHPKFQINLSTQAIDKCSNINYSFEPSIFEAYGSFQPTKKMELRLGKQTLELGNKRLFSVSNWNQKGKTHIGVTFIQKGKRLLSHSFLMTTVFNAAHTTLPYKYLIGNHSNLRLNKHSTITILNTGDVFEDLNKSSRYFVRGTSGLNYSFINQHWRSNFHAYYQYGKSVDEKSIRAYYFLIETVKELKRSRMKLSIELLSGQKNVVDQTNSHSFQPLYGVAHNFNGKLDYFTNFPEDINRHGLLNPFFSYQCKIWKTLQMESIVHLFLTEKRPDLTSGKFCILGIENDTELLIKVNDLMKIDIGGACLIKSDLLTTLRNTNQKIVYWSYIMITFNPSFTHHFKIKK